MVILSCFASLGPARADGGNLDVEIDGELSISSDLSRIRGHVALRTLNRTRQPVEEVPLWLFPERLSEPPPLMDDVMLPRVYPNGFDPGGMTITSVHDADGRALQVDRIRPALARVRLPRAVAEGGEITLVVTYEIRVPERYGPFGRVDDQLTMDGGFLPRIPPQGSEGFLERSPPGPVEWRVRMRWEGEGDLLSFVNGERVRLGGRPETVTGPNAHRVSLVAAGSYDSATLGDDRAGVRFAYKRPRRKALSGEPYSDLGAIDPIGEELATTVSVLDFLRTRLSFPEGPLVMVEAPLRRDIAIAAPGMVLVSDRAFELTPAARFLRVHRVALARAVASACLSHGPAHSEPVRRRHRVRDLMAIHLAEAWEAGIYGGRAGIREILGPGRFIAAVEDVIRAPQIPFQSAWFRVVDDTDIFRDRVTLFSHSHPNGRIWREKLVDKLGLETVDRLVDAVARRGERFVPALARIAPGFDALSYLAQWDDGAPEVNYRLVAVHPIPGGLEAEIAREGAREIEEPVTVVALGAERIVGRWDGDGRSARVKLPGATAADDVILDPDFRLVESDLGHDVHARFDNRTRHPWRALLKGFGFDVNSTTGRVNSTVAGSILRSGDLRHSIALRLYDRERSLGGYVSWLRAFGPKIRSSRRRYGVGSALGVSWLKPLGDSPEGVGVTMSAALADSTTVSNTDPRSGHSMSISAGPVLALHQDVASLGAFAAMGFRLLTPLGRRHVLASRVEGGMHWGDVLDTQQWPAGGVKGVRAIGPYAPAGRHRLFGSLEWRHRLMTNVSWNVLNISWIEAVDGVLFGDVASVTDDVDDLVTERGLYGGVGYGLRVHHRIAGFRPMVLSVDYGVPLLTDGVSSWPPTGTGSLVVAVGQIF